MTEVVQQNKVGRFIKLFRLNAVLDEGETNLGEGEASFLQNFTSECIFRRFPSLNLSSGNSPETRPFQGMNHQQLLVWTDDQGSNGWGGRDCLGFGVAAKDLHNGKHVGSNMVGKGSLQFLE